MTPERFQNMVNKRANERVQKKITEFRQDIRSAIINLDKRQLYNYKAEEANKYLNMIITGSKKGWPSILWEVERDIVEKEFLATMDEIQAALLFADKPDDPNHEIPEDVIDNLKKEN